MSWSRLDREAPELARLGRARLEQTGVALLGTVRPDGSPRISPVEPYLSGGELLFGAMAWSAKARDLARDARCVLHSAVSRPDAGEPELKLYGRAVEASDELRSGCREGWWAERPEAAAVFVLQIDRAAFVGWQLERGLMTVRRWSPGHAETESTRTYP